MLHVNGLAEGQREQQVINMKQLNKAFLALVALASISATVFAQDAGPSGAGRPGRNPEAAQKMKAKMDEIEKNIVAKLGLSDAQKASLKKLQEETQAKTKKLMEERKKAGKGGDRTAMQAKMKAIRDEREAGMKKIMGEKKFAEYQKEMKAAMKKLREEAEKANGGKGGKKGPGGKKPA
jgi:hypothetical protein